MKNNLSQSKAYRAFTNDRNEALESILNKYSFANAIILKRAIEQTIDIVSAHHTLGKMDIYGYKNGLHELERKLGFIYHLASSQIFHMIRRMRQNVFVLSYASELEGISRGKRKKQHNKLTFQELLRHVNKNSAVGGDLYTRIDYYFSNIKREVLKAVELSAVLQSNITETIERVQKALPKEYKVSRPRINLKAMPIREAKRDDTKIAYMDKDLYMGFTDEAMWQNAVDDYLSDELPKDSFDRSEAKQIKVDGETKFEWEAEQDLNHEFVTSVREGEQKAANDNGITDMMWIAIIDKKTDDCCMWRDGLTSKEIEAQLDSTHKDDECEAIVPPAHMFCRCTMAPVTDDFQDGSAVDFKDFDEWLKS